MSQSSIALASLKAHDIAPQVFSNNRRRLSIQLSFNGGVMPQLELLHAWPDHPLRINQCELTIQELPALFSSAS
ncbi:MULTISPECIES: hypothetical protein [unclassified Prochlorococcus]|uniref:hypothetical protein n=1 Tax=unclassified Prochlorococcus TaxID=2627481 RepID=UPI000533B64A|nr:MULTISPECIES: hypothetical protein [unclassified Prochlorococcus]KGG29218.1 hypothetical protein EV13_1166 [Prochlorococcus sp. MIT 0702]KGG35363.1 hypothetical protein EV14_0937 [Prochlorococcus sp. MIT 0703]